MNYIKKLEQDSRLMRGDRWAGKGAIEDFKVHLMSDKFSGTASDGSRKDWIAVADVMARLKLIEDAFFGSERPEWEGPKLS
jgi:hypothetical protein